MIITHSRVGAEVVIEVLGAPDGEVTIAMEVRSPNTGVRRSLGAVRGVSSGGRLVLHGPVLDVDDTWSDLVAQGRTSDGKLLGADINLVK